MILLCKPVMIDCCRQVCSFGSHTLCEHLLPAFLYF